MHSEDISTRNRKSGLEFDRRTILTLLAGTAAAGIGGGRAFARDGEGGILKVASNVNLSTLDPATGRSGYDHSYLYTMFDTLFEWDFEKLTPKPGLAVKWEQPDDRTLILDLAEGVVFHDGAPLDAEAVKFNLIRAKTDERSNIKADLASVDSIEVIGPLRVKLSLNAPNSALVLILSDRAGMMSSPKALQKFGVDSDRNPVGCGAYKFVSFSDNDKLIVTKNDKYWRKERQTLDGIEFSIISELATGLRTVMSGQNNFINALPPQQKTLISRSDKVGSVVSPTQFVNIIYLHCGRPPFDNLKVRQALNYAIDRNAFVGLTDVNVAEPTCGVLPKQHWAYDEQAAKRYPYDPDRARALLKEAGLAGGVDINLIGTPDQRAVQRQEVLIEQTRKVGFRLRFRQLQVPDATAAYMGPEHSGDGYLQQWTGRPDPSLTLNLLFAKNSYFNAGKADPAEGRLEAQQESVATSNLEQRKIALAKLQRIISDNALAVCISIVHDLTAFTANVQKYRPNLLGKPKFEGVTLAAK
jgi:peptide/nickel transport system permease protein/peptide/nickel transport system substrate-binding protein